MPNKRLRPEYPRVMQRMPPSVRIQITYFTIRRGRSNEVEARATTIRREIGLFCLRKKANSAKLAVVIPTGKPNSGSNQMHNQGIDKDCTLVSAMDALNGSYPPNDDYLNECRDAASKAYEDGSLELGCHSS
ncbi:hypothetical protein Tco_0997264, partial [Tanacetum coccineum]